MKNILLVTLLVLAFSAQLVNASDDPVYIDVRTWIEYKVNHIEGDTRIHVSDIVDGVNEQFPDKNTPIKLYCERGVRAQTALEKLKAAGYLYVENLGGIDEVRQARFEGHTDD